MKTDLLYSRPPRLTLPKFIYVLCRYFAFLAHAWVPIKFWGAEIWLKFVVRFYIILSRKVVSHYPEVPASICREWLYFQAIVTFVLLNALDLVLVMRSMFDWICTGPFISCYSIVYAFYRQDRRIGVLLSTVFVSRFFLAVSSVFAFLPSQSFGECCRVLMPKGVMFCFL